MTMGKAELSLRARYWIILAAALIAWGAVLLILLAGLWLMR